jgi:hypothetical protein
MRPPFGDIGQLFSFLFSSPLVCSRQNSFFSDDRVRAICLAMGMIPVLWTSTKDGGKFDTNGLCFSSFFKHTLRWVSFFIY